jgi:pSer/pThr/pTyr-binding forkhead associated (FHA) protein
MRCRERCHLLTQPPVPDEDIRYDRLVFYSERYPTAVVDMDRPVLTVGRGDDQDVQLSGEAVSRRHARIERGEDGTFRVRDEGTTNGTYLGSYKLIEDVAEIWDPVQTIRLGDYWLRLETREELEASRKKVAIVAAVPDIDDPDYETDGGWSPPPDAPAPDHDKIGVEVPIRNIVVAPGSTGILTLEITNQNDFVDHFDVQVVGLPPSWYTVGAEDIDLMPYNRQTASVTFHPPLESRSSAGSHAFELRVTSQAKGISAVRTQCSLDVQPFHAFSSDLYPERVRNRGNFDLSIRNTGNTHTTFNIAARDREQAVRFGIEGGLQYSVAPGTVEEVGVRVEPRRRPLFGQPQFHQLEFTVTPTDEVAGGAANNPRRTGRHATLPFVGCVSDVD